MSATRVCTKCGQEKSVEEFPWKNSLMGRRHAVCKPCTASRSSQWYQDNKTAHIQNVMLHKEQARIEARIYIYEYLASHPCSMCGEADPVVLEFDHIKGKEEEISRLITNGASIDRLEKEMKRCQVLCSNCHRCKTSKERGWFKSGI